MLGSEPGCGGTLDFITDTPTSATWLNLVERWLRDLSAKRIRRGRIASVKEIEACHPGILGREQQTAEAVYLDRQC